MRQVEKIPSSMRAVQMIGRGDYDQLVIANDVLVPTPGAGEVLIRVGAAGVNNTDINTRIGWYGPDTGWSGAVQEFPRIQGADACGEIVATGSGVNEQRRGERVLVEPVFIDPAGTISYFGSEVNGAFADYAVVPAQHAHRIDSTLSDVELASFPCSYSAAENMVVRTGVSAGARVLVTGASGGVGSAAVQLAHRRGAEVVAVAGADKHAAVRAIGAAEVIDRDESLVQHFGAASFDVVLDVVGGPVWPALLEVLRPRGRYAVAGAIAGADVSLDLRVLYLKDLQLIGCTTLDAGVFAGLVAAIERGEVRPLVAATFALEDIVAAQELFLSKRHVGKIVLNCR